VSRSYAGAASAAVLAAALAGVAFVAKGGTELGRSTLVEVLLLLAGGALVAAALLYGPSGRIHGGWSVLALAVLTALTVLSLLWSIAPELTFVDAGRALAYLAVFAAAVGAARLWPKGASVVAKGVLAGAALVVAYALASRVWPGALAEDELSNRIGQPYGYWNAVGTTAALIVPLALWHGSRRAGSLAGNALAYPATGLAALGILLSQSRGALAAALLVALVWFAFVPLRLRSLPVLLLPSLLAAAVAAWALSKDAFSKGLQPLAVREDVAGEFGALVVLMLLLATLAGLGAELLLRRGAPSAELRRRIGIAAIAVACAVPLVLLTSVALSDRGLGGTIDDRVDELTSETAEQPGQGAERFGAASSSRGLYWREAGKVFADRRLSGTGAGTFGISRLRHRKTHLVSRHAHGFVVQTLADTGILGLLATLALLAAWLAAAGRATGVVLPFRRSGDERPRRDWTPERIAVVALALSALAFGLQSIVDWTWFVPAPAVMALVAAGFVAGRGPVSTLAGEAGAAALPRPGPERSATLGGKRIPIPGRARLVAAAAVLLTALLCAWATWQPERAENLSDETLDLIAERDLAQAAEKASDAEDANPLSPRPLFAQASVLSAAGRRDRAAGRLERAVLRFPGEPRTWLRLATFQFGELDQPMDALETLQGALYLDPRSKAGEALFLEARTRLRQEQLAAQARPRARRRLRPRRRATGAP
jgi:O-Antigen ligase